MIQRIKPPPLRELAAGNGRIGNLLTSGRRLLRLEGRLRESLPAELAQGWKLARLDAEALVLVVESPAWATRLRYSQALLKRAAQGLIDTPPRAVKIKVSYTTRPPEPPPPRELSASAAATLRSAASSIDDERLRRALERLASRARR